MIHICLVCFRLNFYRPHGTILYALAMSLSNIIPFKSCKIVEIDERCLTGCPLQHHTTSVGSYVLWFQYTFHFCHIMYCTILNSRSVRTFVKSRRFSCCLPVHRAAGWMSSDRLSNNHWSHITKREVNTIICSIQIFNKSHEKEYEFKLI